MTRHRSTTRFSVTLWFLAVVLVLSTFATACSSAAQSQTQAREIALEITDSGFQPSKVEVKAGERVVFVLTNRGSKDHEFESDELHIEEVVVQPGKSKRIEWTAPSRPGTFEAEDDKNGLELEIEVK